MPPSSAPSPSAPIPGPTGRDVLTQVEAEARAARVAEVAYTLQLDLTAGAATYRGETTIAFALDQAEGEGETFLDFRGRTIERLEVNGTAVEEPQWSGYRLTLPGALLQASNTVHLVYENEYDHTGDGFHQFIDPEDGEEYLYSNFEPYDAHRLFPCFDQPDLKASYKLTVDGPAAWELISNAPEAAREELPDGRLRRRFERTERFSTYLFALIAGPYAAFREEHQPAGGGDAIPLGLFCRRSMVPHLDTDELFEVTRQGFDFYADFFDYPYPFTKYDQVFVPEFNAGAMENVGAVTHSEHLVFRDPPTDSQRLNRAETLLHEMAHMWFGNLVTMRWWNDLWLNESFATYMAYLSLVEATRFTSAWQAFNSGMKNWAYRQDQLITTHPIAGEVADTDQTLLNFDGITYGKGAAVLKQLVATVGIDGFRSGMRRYFRRHQFGNTTVAQFLDALGEGLELDLHRWAQSWLETPSLNTVAARWETAVGQLSALRVTQTAPEQYPTLRPHRLEIALVRDEGDQAVVDTVDVQLLGDGTAVDGAAGRPAPALVFPNHHDHGFVKVALDEASLAYLREHLGRIQDPLLRQLLWQALWNMVRDQQLRSTDYLPLAAAHIRAESDHELIETILANAQATIARYVPDDRRDEQAHRFSEVAWEALHATSDHDLQITWARVLVGLAITAEDIARVCRLADGALTVPGFTVDQDMRWAIAARTVAHGMEGSDARVAAERERDPSDRGQRALLRCEVSAPDAAGKEAAWERFHGEGYGSLHLTAAAMGGFQWNVQRELLSPYRERFFGSVAEVFRRGENEFSRTYFGGLFPAYRVDEETLRQSQALLSELGDELPLLTRSLLEANDDLERTIACRAFAAS